MALTLTIQDKQFTGKPTFAMARYANENYGKYIEKANKYAQGIENILSGVIEGSVDSIVQYWDAALAHLKERPSIAEIETALEERIEQEGDTEPLLKEIYRELSTSGFFKKTIKEFWKNIEMMQDFGATDKEKEQNKKAYDMMQKLKAEIEE